MANDESGLKTSTAGRSPSSQPEHFHEALGRAIKVLRTAHGLGRRELAESATLSYSYLTEIENGTKQVSSRILQAIADALGVPVSELIQAAEAWGADSSRPVEGSSALGDLARTVVGSADAFDPAPPAEVRQIEPWAKRPRRWSKDIRATAERPGRGASRPIELIHRFEQLSEEDQERVLDLVRRLGG